MFAPVPIWAEDDELSVEVAGRFKDRAVVRINGKQYVLNPGQRSPEGVKLIEARDDGALLEIDGVKREVRMGAVIRPLAAPGSAGGDTEVVVYRDISGMYNTVGSINGLAVPFLVDTGASSIAMNDAQARRLGIDYRVVGQKSWAETASGVVPSYQVMLSRVKLGSIELHNVQAIVIEGDQPSRALLGMSFLGRLQILNEGDRMTLRKKY